MTPGGRGREHHSSRGAAASFWIPESIELAHALVAHVARDLGVRVLSIKGPAAEFHGLRPSRVSSDADVLVEPQGYAAFCSEMKTRGWAERIAYHAPSVLDRYSCTLAHPQWPCDIDIHSHYPGMFADHASAFDAMWAARERIWVAHTMIEVPSRAASVVIGLLHALRSPRTALGEHEYRFLLNLVQSDDGHERIADIVQVAAECGALWALRHELKMLGVPGTASDATEEQRAAWQVVQRAKGDMSALGWVFALRAARPTAWFSLLRRALWVRRTEIPRNASDPVPSIAQALRYQTVRWRRGLLGLWRYLRERGDS